MSRLNKINILLAVSAVAFSALPFHHHIFWGVPFAKTPAGTLQSEPERVPLVECPGPFPGFIFEVNIRAPWVAYE